MRLALINDRSIEVQPRETLLAAAHRNGIEMPSSCRVGGCGACKCKLASGEVEELTQRTFLRLLEVKDRYASNGTFRAFTLGVARMVLLEFYRSRARDARVDFGVSTIARLSTTPSVKIARKDERALVVAAMQQLSVDHQIVLELHYWEGLSVAEVAQATEVSPGTVKSRLHRARAALEAALGGRFPMESTRR